MRLLRTEVLHVHGEASHHLRNLHDLELQHMALAKAQRRVSQMAPSAAWPREFRVASCASAAPKFWSHELYRGPRGQPVRILYSRSKLQSEEIAQEFLQERVLGFDMEWPWQNKDRSDVALQQRIGLIQLASEDKIALFHIGLHAGHTAKDVLAPALREIIESEHITKAGVGILNADFSRLHRWFDLRPRGALELSHLHNLVTYGLRHPNKVTTRMKALSKLVEEHLGLPLFKGKVRTSNWSRPLNQAQVLYAAADAYAGLMLYHCINAKRLAMVPAPPLPLHADTYLPMAQGMGSIRPVQLASSSEDASGISAVDFFHQNMTDQAPPLRQGVAPVIEDQEHQDVQGKDEQQQQQQEEDTVEDKDATPPVAQAELPAAKATGPSAFERHPKSHVQEEMGLVVVGRRGRHILLEQRELGASSRVPEPRGPERARQRHNRETASEPTRGPNMNQTSRPARTDPETTEALFTRLSAHRKRIAKERRCPAFVVAHNTLLSAISERRPRNEQELLRIQGIGKVKAELYGKAWLDIVHNFLDEHTNVALGDEQEKASPAHSPTTPTSQQTQAEKVVNEEPHGNRNTPAVLHTGLSFQMENALLEEETVQATIKTSDDVPAFERSLGSPAPSTLKRKRERLDHLIENQSEQRPVLSRPALQCPSPVANSTRQLALQATIGPTQSTTNTKKTISTLTDAKPTSLFHPQHAAQREISSPYDAPQGSAPMTKTQAATEAQIFRNKLLAFNRRVTSTVILSEVTIEHIIRNPPRTTKELVQIPNIIPFANACARQNQCLLTFILKSTQRPASTIC